MNTSDAMFMGFARETAEMSDDLGTKTGCIIVDDRGRTIAWGFNDLPTGVDDTPERRARPEKYHWTEHAERNAIYGAARNGTSLRGSTAYVNWFPCVDCARALICSGVSRLVCVEADMDHPKYADEFRIARVMLQEAGVELSTVVP